MEGNESENVPSSATNGEDLQNVSFSAERNYICIAYPGIVDNDEKALATLGGLESIQQTFQNPAKKLEIRMRPSDVYCKPALGTSTESTSLLLRVKRRRRKSAVQTGSQESTARGDNQEEWKADILGTVKSTVRFQGMCDFQYLPMTRQEDGTYRNILKDLTFSKFESLKAWLKRDDIPLFLPPYLFSRTDVPTSYSFRPSLMSQESEVSAEQEPTNLIRSSRKKRTLFTQFRKFEDKSVPSAPKEGATEALTAIMRDIDRLGEIRKLFEERPVWSKNALMHRSGLDKTALKVILPLVAYYCVTGPWRSLWVRLGYDPLTTPAAKQYQVLDCRIRQRGAVDELFVKGKRSVFSYTIPNTVRKQVRHTSKIKVSCLEPPTEETKKADEKDDSTFVYRQGVRPPFRCMFYQMCDVMDEKCQKLLHQNDGQETECTEKDGWCIKDMGTRCRAIIYKQLKKLQLRDEFPKAHKGSTDIHMTESDEDSIDDTEPMDEDFASDEEMNDMETEMLDAV